MNLTEADVRKIVVELLAELEPTHRVASRTRLDHMSHSIFVKLKLDDKNFMFSIDQDLMREAAESTIRLNIEKGVKKLMSDKDPNYGKIAFDAFIKSHKREWKRANSGKPPKFPTWASLKIPTMNNWTTAARRTIKNPPKKFFVGKEFYATYWDICGWCDHKGEQVSKKPSGSLNPWYYAGQAVLDKHNKRQPF